MIILEMCIINLILKKKKKRKKRKRKRKIDIKTIKKNTREDIQIKMKKW
jgi:hypothetical protein